MQVLNLGWGIQSFTMAAMVALGELEKIDVAIHADTTHERSETYKFAKKYTPWLEHRNVRVVTVKSPQPYSELTGLKTDLPAYTFNGKSYGRLRRQCTGEWKIAPIRRWLQANRRNNPVEQWVGISIDEIERMRHSDVKYITNRYPLVEKRMSRLDCVNWIQSHGLDVPVKSSCVFCPFHSEYGWNALKDTGGTDWEKAVMVDRAIRKARPPFDLFLYRACVPIEEIVTSREAGQLEMFSSEECSGMCFL